MEKKVPSFRRCVQVPVTTQETGDWGTFMVQLLSSKMSMVLVSMREHQDLFESLTVYVSVCTIILCARVDRGPMGQRFNQIWAQHQTRFIVKDKKIKIYFSISNKYFIFKTKGGTLSWPRELLCSFGDCVNVPLHVWKWERTVDEVCTHKQDGCHGWWCHTGGSQVL